ncbi:MAG: 16S rRNA (cytosine(967)-C(5))-methyltransferase RsmB [Fusobacteriaceae bacterium]|nr:16S rRNA (cytosine(967)-C(5))-methyltransferase RsmB [Fusobacteriaceae bacterium]
MSIKLKIIEILREYRSGKYSNIILGDYIKKNNFTKGEKGFLTEVFYGVIRNELFLDYMIDKRVKSIKKDWIRELLRISFYQITFMKSDDKGVVWEGSELAKKKFGVPVGKFINGVLRAYIREKDEDIKELKESGKLDILYSCPMWFYEVAKKKYGERLEEFLTSIKKVPYISFRVNKLKYSEAEFESLLANEGISIIKKVDSVYYVDSGSLLNSKEFSEGKITVQDGSSYLSAANLNPKEGESVIDTCSAPGGKSAVLAEIMNNKGEILAFDIHQHKLKLIDENCKKLGIEIVKPIKMDARKIVHQGKKFDKILVDAPCSGYGVLRKKPEALYNKNMENIEELAQLQYEILTAAGEVLKVGGELVYSTCTITDEENINNIERFLKENKNFSVEKLYIPENVSGVYDRFGGFQIDYTEECLDSFYIIKLKKI